MDPDAPVVYRRACPAFFDDNLNTLVPALKEELLLAHIRAATYLQEAIIVDETVIHFSLSGRLGL